MTTGRINQVTTFQKPLPWPIAYSRCAGGHSPLSRHGVRQLLFTVDPPQLAGTFPPQGGVQATSNPQMASPCFPFSHVLSKIPLSRGETKVTALGEDYQRPATPERHATDVADPLVVSCIRIDHRQAIHLLQHRSIASHKDGSRLQR
jgi:hypothetical protein